MPDTDLEIRGGGHPEGGSSLQKKFLLFSLQVWPFKPFRPDFGLFGLSRENNRNEEEEEEEEGKQ